MPRHEEERLSDRLEAAVKKLDCDYDGFDSLPEDLRKELEFVPTAVEFLRGLSGVRGALTFLRLVGR